jgi:hypothetical protein
MTMNLKKPWLKSTKNTLNVQELRILYYCLRSLGLNGKTALYNEVAWFTSEDFVH